MTLRKKDTGDLSIGKVTLLCTIMGTMATLVMATPTLIDFVKFGVSPWVTMPSQMEDLRKDVKEIKQMQEMQMARQINKVASK